jgi:hypothetical protein
MPSAVSWLRIWSDMAKLLIGTRIVSHPDGDIDQTFQLVDVGIGFYITKRSTS